jgi:hypothetical protein
MGRSRGEGGGGMEGEGEGLRGGRGVQRSEGERTRIHIFV